MELIPLLQQCDIEKLGVVHVGERVMLVSLAKALESKLDKRTKILTHPCTMSKYMRHCVVLYVSTVDSPLTDTPNSGHQSYNGQCHMYQLKSPYI